MNENPFTLMFGKEPYLTIRRDHIVSKVYSDFSSALPASQIYILIGARGAGKTVLLTEMYNTFEDEGWVVADVNPHRNILEDLAAQVYDKGKLKRLFLKGSFDISFHGVSFSLEGKEPVSSVSTVVERMLNNLKKKGKRLLITLDEVTSTDRIKEFAHDFQGFVRKGLPVFLVMTGLHENVMSLQNDKSLTFLYRAPKILLDPLDIRAIEKSYAKVLGVGEEKAQELAKMTKGYGFGYQLLGYLFYSHRVIDEPLLDEFDYQLRINAYDKIWSSVSENEKKILRLLCRADEVPVSEIMAETGFNNKDFSSYRERLIQKGVAISKRRGFLSLSLPRFDIYISHQ